MLAVAERDCVGTVKDPTGKDVPFLYMHGEEHDIDPASSVGIHFKLPPDEMKIARKCHFQRVKAAKVNWERMKAAVSEVVDPFEVGAEPESLLVEEAPKSEAPAASPQKKTVAFLKCSECGKEIKGQFGLQAHMRSHKKAKAA